MTDATQLAARLDDAVRSGLPIPQLSLETALSLDEAYDVQRAGVDLRRRRGEQVTGVKLGFTSRAKAEQMGVSDVIVGVVTDAMEIVDGGIIDIARGVHPRVEPEVAFRLGESVDPTDPAIDLANAVTDVAPALEVIDSRYRDFRFSLADVVADNTSASAYVIGPWQSIDDARATDGLAARAVELAVDGVTGETGSTEAILGDPMAALPAIQRMAARHGHELPAGAVLLAGAATAALPLQAGTTFTATVAGLGAASLRVAGGNAHE
ncbi:2-oxo-3-hexenedioate decarboxylase [Prauserella sediminis]|uniref:2-oxo-3-hexenedioate decarboxylase n=1 Tax=Prauserella sediminis TaxID=577680 RepID=A0A839XKK7_9PSEU|nr:fumarylacetoacetate hydrolase family protein [Prauserella sediminis]MBB3664452.1 2-oxo-3-hexenedioate decarboxylase [Prauserella sediminis]